MKIPPQLSQAVSETDGISDFDLCDAIWSLVSEKYHSKWNLARTLNGILRKKPRCNYPESIYAAGLPEHWWTAYGVHAFEYDVMAGGIKQFLENHDGLTNEQTAAAFRTIGHPDLADAFLVVGNAYVAFRKKHCPDYSKLSDKERDEMDTALNLLLRDVGENFRRIYDGVNLRMSLAKHIRTNIKLFE